VDAGRLILEFCGDVHELSPGEVLTFGRSADLVLDDNPYLHRVVGRIDHRGGTWWLHNCGRTVALTVHDLVGSSSATVGPGSGLALIWGRFRLGFRAGPVPYELDGVLEEHERLEDLLGPGAASSTVTLEWGRVELNDDQRALLLVMCEHRLRRPWDRTTPPPANRQVAARLGWSLAKFNRKLDHLCEKLARSGVPGVHGDLGLLAADRRSVLVDHAVSVGLVTVDDLAEPSVDASTDGPDASVCGSGGTPGGGAALDRPA
jgi:hypothetical protein